MVIVMICTTIHQYSQKPQKFETSIKGKQINDDKATDTRAKIEKTKLTKTKENTRIKHSEALQ